MKVLINVPDLKRRGGVAGLYNTLKIQDKYDYVDLYNIHNDGNRLIGLITKYAAFFFKSKKYSIVHINPSLGYKSFLRDALFILIARINSCKTLVYWHGWEESFEKRIKDSFVLLKLMQITFLKADGIVVLGTVFKNKIQELGYRGRIWIETNAVDDSYLKNETVHACRPDEDQNILFLSRIETEKGIYIALDAIKILQHRLSNPVRFIIAGDGSQIDYVKAYIKKNDIKNVIVHGHVEGVLKHKVLANSSIYLFPTYFPEGLPITILEAMLYGLVVITRPVAGIPDVVEDGANGALVNSQNPQDFADAIEQFLTDKKKMIQVAETNRKKARAYFISDKVNERLVNIYLEINQRKHM
jgi:glycosyltransferase involved in cell wall biosynthesis